MSECRARHTLGASSRGEVRATVGAHGECRPLGRAGRSSLIDLSRRRLKRHEAAARAAQATRDGGAGAGCARSR